MFAYLNVCVWFACNSFYAAEAEAEAEAERATNGGPMSPDSQAGRGSVGGETRPSAGSTVLDVKDEKSSAPADVEMVTVVDIQQPQAAAAPAPTPAPAPVAAAEEAAPPATTDAVAAPVPSSVPATVVHPDLKNDDGMCRGCECRAVVLNVFMWGVLCVNRLLRC